jgi:hypothetical protein
VGRHGGYVTVIGASGALGFGSRCASAGRRADRGRLARRRRAEETVQRLREAAPDASFEGDANGPAAARGEVGSSVFRFATSPRR